MQKEPDSSTLICTGAHPEKKPTEKLYSVQTPDLPKHYRAEFCLLPKING